MPKSRKLRPSSTPGKTKNENCQKTAMKRRYVNDSRWYKKDVNNYIKACEHINKQKGNLQSSWIKESLDALAT